MPLELASVPECINCGTCCFSFAPDYLRVFGCDYERLTEEDAERYVVFKQNRAYMRLEAGHCAALTLELATGRYLCSIYERRPDVCRALERGSGHCQAERAEKGDRPIQLRLQRGVPPPARP